MRVTTEAQKVVFAKYHGLMHCNSLRIAFSLLSSQYVQVLILDHERSNAWHGEACKV